MDGNGEVPAGKLGVQRFRKSRILAPRGLGAYHRPALRKLTTEALLSLMELHYERRQQLRKMLNEPPFVRDGGTGTCSNCHSAVNYNTWRELKFIIDQEMEIRPLGDTIVGDGLLNWPAARAC